MQEQMIKEKINERYGKIALTGTSRCCTPTIEFDDNKSGSSCCSPSDSATVIGYDNKELESIPESSVLGVGCGAPLHHAGVREGETIANITAIAGNPAIPTFRWLYNARDKEAEKILFRLNGKPPGLLKLKESKLNASVHILKQSYGIVMKFFLLSSTKLIFVTRLL